MVALEEKEGVVGARQAEEVAASTRAWLVASEKRSAREDRIATQALSHAV